MASLSEKRKQKVLTVDEKLENVSSLDKNHSLAAIACKYRIGKSTVSDIKRLQSMKQLPLTNYFPTQ